MYVDHLQMHVDHLQMPFQQLLPIFLLFASGPFMKTFIYFYS